MSIICKVNFIYLFLNNLQGMSIIWNITYTPLIHKIPSTIYHFVSSTLSNLKGQFHQIYGNAHILSAWLYPTTISVVSSRSKLGKWACLGSCIWMRTTFKVCLSNFIFVQWFLRRSIYFGIYFGYSNIVLLVSYFTAEIASNCCDDQW